MGWGKSHELMACSGSRSDRSFSYVPLGGKLEVHLYQGRTKGSCPGTVAPDILIGPTWQSVQHGLATFSIFTIEEGLS